MHTVQCNSLIIFNLCLLRADTSLQTVLSPSIWQKHSSSCFFFFLHTETVTLFESLSQVKLMVVWGPPSRGLWASASLFPVCFLCLRAKLLWHRDMYMCVQECVLKGACMRWECPPHLSPSQPVDGFNPPTLWSLPNWLCISRLQDAASQMASTELHRLPLTLPDERTQLTSECTRCVCTWGCRKSLNVSGLHFSGVSVGRLKHIKDDGVWKAKLILFSERQRLMVPSDLQVNYEPVADSDQIKFKSHSRDFRLL